MTRRAIFYLRVFDPKKKKRKKMQGCLNGFRGFEIAGVERATVLKSSIAELLR